MRLIQYVFGSAQLLFGDIFDFQNGFAFKSSLFKNVGNPILRITNIQNNRINDNELVFFDDGDYKENLSSFLVNPGDIVIAMSGATTGKVGVNGTTKQYYLNQRVGKFIPKDGIVLNRYLYHLLSNKSEQIYKMSDNGSQPNLSSDKLKQLIVHIPSIEEQRRIVNILDRFDKLCNDIAEGLPAEIDNRNRQYGWYRNKLLNFTKEIGL